MPNSSIDGISASNIPNSQPQHARSAQQDTESDDSTTKVNDKKETSYSGAKEQSAHDKQEISKLATRDREVRAHEASHKNAGGSLIRGAAQFTYQKGPDGKQYASGGEVSIDTSSVPDDPQATLQKANQIRAAALAPTNPSTQDKSVAANAASMAANAHAEIVKQQAAEKAEKLESSTTDLSDENNNIESTQTSSRPEANQSESNDQLNTASQNTAPIPKYVAVTHAPSDPGSDIDILV